MNPMSCHYFCLCIFMNLTIHIRKNWFIFFWNEMKCRQSLFLSHSFIIEFYCIKLYILSIHSWWWSFLLMFPTWNRTLIDQDSADHGKDTYHIIFFWFFYCPMFMRWLCGFMMIRMMVAVDWMTNSFLFTGCSTNTLKQYFDTGEKLFFSTSRIWKRISSFRYFRPVVIEISFCFVSYFYLLYPICTLSLSLFVHVYNNSDSCCLWSCCCAEMNF